MSLIFKENDPLAPISEPRPLASSPGEILQSQIRPKFSKDGSANSQGGWFALSAPVGMFPAPSRKQDVLKVETLLGQAGYYDIQRLRGPTGFWGAIGDKAVKDYQKDNGLKVDGLLNPDGPTIVSLKSRMEDVFKSWNPPSVGEVDAHHNALARGEAGQLTFSNPPLRLERAGQVSPEIESANRRTVDYLSGYGGNQGLDESAARHIASGDQMAIPRYRNLIEQIFACEPKRAHAFAWGIVDNLQDETMREDFLGASLPERRPVGLRMSEWQQGKRTGMPSSQDGGDEWDDGGGGGESEGAGTGGGADKGGSNAGSGGDALDLRDPLADARPEGERAEPTPPVSEEPQRTQEPNNGDGGADKLQEAPAKEAAPANGWIASKSADDLLKEANGGHLASGTDKGSKECVALVKHAVPGIGRAGDWKEGAKIKGPDDPPLASGTAIATFKDGTYQNNSTGNHAAIVIEPGEKNGKKGYWVLDQNRDNASGRTFLEFNSTSKRHTSHMENYSVIRKGK